MSNQVTIRRRQRRVLLESLERKNLLAADVSFADPVDLTVFAQPARIVVDDVNRDGIPDLMASTWECCGNGDVSLLLGQGDGTFTPFVVRDRTIFWGPYFTTMDVNGDGYLDLVGARAANLQGVWVALNRGMVNGTWDEFEKPVRHSMSGPTQDVSAGDFDGDGDMDLAVGHPTSVPVLLNEGTVDGEWQGFAEQVDYTAGSHSSTVVNGDVDNDGDLDLVVGNLGGDISVLLGNGDGTFADAVSYPVGSRASGVRIADLDGDGDLDAAVPVFDTRNVAILANNGDGTFSDPVMYVLSHRAYSLETGDIDADGDTDLVVNADTRLLLLINDGDGNFEQHASQLVPTTNFIQDLAVADVDLDGDADVVAAMGFGATPSINVFWNTIPPALTGDLNGDGAVDSADAGAMFENWGGPGLGDLNEDGIVDAADAGIMFEHWTGDATPAPVISVPVPTRGDQSTRRIGEPLAVDQAMADQAREEADDWLPQIV